MPTQIVLIIFLSLALLLGLIVAWIMWMRRNFKRGRKVLFFAQLAASIILFVWVTWITEIFPGSSTYYANKQIRELTGYYLDLTEHFTYESPRAFNGDGYSILVYELTEEDANNFLHPQPDFFKDYPSKSEFRDHWDQQKWKKGPILETERKYLDFALNEVPSINQEDYSNLSVQFDHIRSIMSSNNCVYAFNYLSHSDSYIGNIDFFIISPEQKKLIIINHNT